MNYAYIRPINISLYHIHDQVIDMLMIKLGHRSMMGAVLACKGFDI